MITIDSNTFYCENRCETCCNVHYVSRTDSINPNMRFSSKYFNVIAVMLLKDPTHFRILINILKKWIKRKLMNIAQLVLQLNLKTNIPSFNLCRSMFVITTIKYIEYTWTCAITDAYIHRSNFRQYLHYKALQRFKYNYLKESKVWYLSWHCGIFNINSRLK